MMMSITGEPSHSIAREKAEGEGRFSGWLSSGWLSSGWLSSTSSTLLEASDCAGAGAAEPDASARVLECAFIYLLAILRSLSSAIVRRTPLPLGNVTIALLPLPTMKMLDKRVAN